MQGITHWRAICHFNLGTYLQADNDTTAAREEYEKCLEISRELLGEQNPSVIVVNEKITALHSLHKDNH